MSMAKARVRVLPQGEGELRGLSTNHFECAFHVANAPNVNSTKIAAAQFPEDFYSA